MIGYKFISEKKQVFPYLKITYSAGLIHSVFRPLSIMNKCLNSSSSTMIVSIIFCVGFKKCILFIKVLDMEALYHKTLFFTGLMESFMDSKICEINKMLRRFFLHIFRKIKFYIYRNIFLKILNCFK